MLLLSCPYSPCEHVAGAFDERLFRGQISLVVDLFNLRRNGDLRSPPAKPTGAGTTPIPGPNAALGRHAAFALLHRLPWYLGS